MFFLGLRLFLIFFFLGGGGGVKGLGFERTMEVFVLLSPPPPPKKSAKTKRAYQKWVPLGFRGVTSFCVWVHN